MSHNRHTNRSGATPYKNSSTPINHPARKLQQYGLPNTTFTSTWANITGNISTFLQNRYMFVLDNSNGGRDYFFEHVIENNPALAIAISESGECDFPVLIAEMNCMVAAFQGKKGPPQIIKGTGKLLTCDQNPYGPNVIAIDNASQGQCDADPLAWADEYMKIFGIAMGASLGGCSLIVISCYLLNSYYNNYCKNRVVANIKLSDRQKPAPAEEKAEYEVEPAAELPASYFSRMSVFAYNATIGRCLRPKGESLLNDGRPRRPDFN